MTIRLIGAQQARRHRPVASIADIAVTNDGSRTARRYANAWSQRSWQPAVCGDATAAAACREILDCRRVPVQVSPYALARDATGGFEHKPNGFRQHGRARRGSAAQRREGDHAM